MFDGNIFLIIAIGAFVAGMLSHIVDDTCSGLELEDHHIFMATKDIITTKKVSFYSKCLMFLPFVLTDIVMSLYIIGFKTINVFRKKAC